MTLWKVKSDGDYIVMGNQRRKMLTANGCNEPFKGRFWCPRKRWFMNGPCPFLNKQECGNYRQICGTL